MDISVLSGSQFYRMAWRDACLSPVLFYILIGNVVGFLPARIVGDKVFKLTGNHLALQLLDGTGRLHADSVDPFAKLFVGSSAESIELVQE